MTGRAVESRCPPPTPTGPQGEARPGTRAPGRRARASSIPPCRQPGHDPRVEIEIEIASPGGENAWRIAGERKYCSWVGWSTPLRSERTKAPVPPGMPPGTNRNRTPRCSSREEPVRGRFRKSLVEILERGLQRERPRVAVEVREGDDENDPASLPNRGEQAMRSAGPGQDRRRHHGPKSWSSREGGRGRISAVQVPVNSQVSKYWVQLKVLAVALKLVKL